METIKIDKDCLCLIDKGKRYEIPASVDIEANLIINLDKPLLIKGCLKTSGGHIDTRGGHINTSGGYIDTNNGNIKTSGGNIKTSASIPTGGGCIYTGGGGIYTDGGNIDTSGGYIDTNSGDIDTNGGDIDTNGGYINTGGGYIDTGKGIIKCGILYWRLMCLPKAGKIIVKKVRPDDFLREYWEERLGIKLEGCWREIEEQLAPILCKIPELLKDPKWTPTERWIIESWLPETFKDLR